MSRRGAPASTTRMETLERMKSGPREAAPNRPLRIVSWNLLRTIGASVTDVTRLIRRESPDLLVMQEVTSAFDGLCDHAGGYFVRAPMPNRIHGLAVWSPTPLPRPPVVSSLPPGAMFRRICQVIEVGDFTVANVHLSHGQVLNRRQLRRIAELLPARAAVVGDFNIVGPHLLAGFRDVGPRRSTHRMGDVVPLRLDRCLVRGLACSETRVLPRASSDHSPILMALAADALLKPRRWRLIRDKAGLAERRHRAA